MSKAKIASGILLAVVFLGIVPASKSTALENPVLSVVISPNTLTSANIVPGVSNFEFVSFVLTAENEDIQLTSITVTKSGTLPDGDIQNVRLFFGHDQLGKALPYFVNGKAAFGNFKMFIPNHVSWNIFIKADVNQRAFSGSTVSFGIGTASDITGGAESQISVNGVFPVNGGKMTVASSCSLFKSYLPFVAKRYYIGW